MGPTSGIAQTDILRFTMEILVIWCFSLVAISYKPRSNLRISRDRPMKGMFYSWPTVFLSRVGSADKW